MFLRKAPLNCDYVYDIFNDIFGFFDCDKHVSALVQDQERINSDRGAWSESFNFHPGEEAPQTTAEAIIALLPYADRTEVKDAIKRGCQYLIKSQNNDGGWKDMIGYSVSDATGCVVAALVEAKRTIFFDVPLDLFDKATDFLISQQNRDGGWCTVQDQESKMHYTFFALWGLASCRETLQNKTQMNNTIEKGVDWILRNGSNRNDEGLSLSPTGEASPVATALGILCFLNINWEAQIRNQWLEFLRKNENDGIWPNESDTSLVHDQRRTYEFRAIPWIVESLVRNGERLDSQIVKNSLRKLKEYEISGGGFVKNPGDTIPTVWQTTWSLIMMYYLKQELVNNLRLYVDDTIKNSKELSRKIENYEKELKPEKTLMTAFGGFAMAFVVATTYMLYVLTNVDFGKLLWYSFFVISSAAIAILIAVYWWKKQKLDDLRILILGIIWTAITLIVGIIA